jgi:hypothetical protein
MCYGLSVIFFKIYRFENFLVKPCFFFHGCPCCLWTYQVSRVTSDKSLHGLNFFISLKYTSNI